MSGIKKTIRDVEKRLTWPVSRTTHTGPLDIISDPVTRTHVIRFPSDIAHAGDVRPIEYLHELAHATLAEREPVFCVHGFLAPGLEMDGLLSVLSDPVRATADWFVDDLVMQWAPKEQAAFIAEHIELMLRLAAQPDLPPDLIFAVGHIIAQGVLYLRITPPRIVRTLPNAVAIMDAFLSVHPRRPTQENFSSLFNLLLTRVCLVAAWDSSKSAWIVFPS